MSHEQGFLDQLRADPADQVTRLVYADWLDERGDPRGAYLRAEQELAGLPEEDPRFADLDRAVSEQAAGMKTDWLAVAGHRWDVWLLGHLPDAKILAIKVLRAMSGLGLKEAKDLVDAVPTRLLVCCDRTLAQRTRMHLINETASGGLVRVQMAIRPTAFARKKPGWVIPESYRVLLVEIPVGNEPAVIARMQGVFGWGQWAEDDLQQGGLPLLLAAYSDERLAREAVSQIEDIATVEIEHSPQTLFDLGAKR